MAIHDTIGDFLTTIRNASNARKASCLTRYSNMRIGIATILKNEGYIDGFREHKEDGGGHQLEILLKYVEEQPAIVGLQRHSRPGKRIYVKSDEIPKVLGGLGISILTTSRGVVNDRDARRLKVGGELICKVW